MADLDQVAVHRSLIRLVSTPAASITWSSGCAPVIVSGAGPGSCSPTPWACAPPGALAAVRAGYAKLLAERVARSSPPVSLPPPPLSARADTVAVTGACLLCGVGAVALPAARVVQLGGPERAADETWIGPVTVTRRADSLVGWLCPPCAAAYRQEGSWGASTIERAVLAHLEATGRAEDATALRGRLTGGERPVWPSYLDLFHRATTRRQPPPRPSAQRFGLLTLTR